MFWRLVVVTFLTILTVSGEAVTLQSNGTSVHMLVGPTSSAFADPFTGQSFTDAKAGPLAIAITPNPGWLQSLPANPSAVWIGTNSTAGTNQGATALYAIDFFLTVPISIASLDLRFAVDDMLGGGLNQGVYLNSFVISGSSTGGSFGTQFSITRTDIASLLQVGTNTLFINATNTGGPGGLIFSATILTNENTVPEPSSLLLTAPILAGLAFLRKKKLI